MARTSVLDSATSQFYINLEDNTALDDNAATDAADGYAVFGEVVSGMEVVDAIGALETESRGGLGTVPVETVLIERVIRSLPDLEVLDASDLSITAEPATAISVPITIRNSGIAEAVNENDAAAPIETFLYMAPHKPFGPDDPNAQYVGGFTLMSLAPDANALAEVTFTTPAEPGYYYLLAEVDANDVVAESYESNNLGLTITLLVEPNEPELILADPETLSYEAEPNAVVEIEVTAENIGTTMARNNADPNEPFWVRLYLATESDFLDEQVVGEFDIASLAWQGSASEDISFNAPLDRGTYYLRAVVDDACDVAEYDESNNTGTTMTLEVEIAPNLSFKKFTAKAGRVRHNDQFKISGEFDADPALFAAAENIDIEVGPYATTLSVAHFEQRSNSPVYVYRADSGVTTCMLDFHSGKFFLKAKDIDLQGFSDPAKVALSFGQYYGWAEADEDMINGRKPIPMIFNQGREDALRVDHYVFGTTSGQYKDSLVIRGALATSIEDVDLTDKKVTIKWGTKTYTVTYSADEDDPDRYADGIYKYKSSGNVRYAKFDLVGCEFTIVIRGVYGLGRPPKDFIISFKKDSNNDFEETVNVAAP